MEPATGPCLVLWPGHRQPLLPRLPILLLKSLSSALTHCRFPILQCDSFSWLDLILGRIPFQICPNDLISFPCSHAWISFPCLALLCRQSQSPPYPRRGKKRHCSVEQRRARLKHNRSFYFFSSVFTWWRVPTIFPAPAKRDPGTDSIVCKFWEDDAWILLHGTMRIAKKGLLRQEKWSISNLSISGHKSTDIIVGIVAISVNKSTIAPSVSH